MGNVVLVSHWSKLWRAELNDGVTLSVNNRCGKTYPLLPHNLTFIIPSHVSSVTNLRNITVANFSVTYSFLEPWKDGVLLTTGQSLAL